MIDLLYNGILATIIALWVLGIRGAYVGQFVAILRKYYVPISAALWALFVVFLMVFIADFDYFDRIHDIDEAVDAAVSYYDVGINPYEEYVVPRFTGKYSPSVGNTLGPYNYMPLDLLVYHAAYEVVGALDEPVWFVLMNLLFSGLALALLRQLVDASWVAYLPLAGIVMLFYSFDNASLTLLLMVSSVYAHQRSPRYPEALAIVLMGLATLTKVYAAIPFVVLMLYELQRSIGSRDLWRLGRVCGAVAASGAVALLVMLPFGVSPVLDAAVFFHTSEELRVGTSVGGTVLAELVIGNEYYSMISAGLVFASLVVGMRMRSLNDRVLLATTIFLMVAVKSSLAPLSVAGVFLALKLKELSDKRGLEQPQERRRT